MAVPRKPPAVRATSDAGTRFAAVAAAFARRRDVVQKRMFNTENALAVDGKIFTMLTPKGAFVVKLPKDRVDVLVQAGDGERFGPGARKMKEWVAIDPAADADWLVLAKEAYAFVKPKV